MGKNAILTIILCLFVVGPASATECEKLWPYVMEAKDRMIMSFVKYSVKEIDAEAGNLIFWDAFIQMQCSEGGVVETPLNWLSEKNKGLEMTPYTAGFLLWLENLKRYEGLDMTPAGLVGGRSFE